MSPSLCLAQSYGTPEQGHTAAPAQRGSSPIIQDYWRITFLRRKHEHKHHNWFVLKCSSMNSRPHRGFFKIPAAWIDGLNEFSKNSFPTSTEIARLWPVRLTAVLTSQLLLFTFLVQICPHWSFRWWLVRSAFRLSSITFRFQKTWLCVLKYVCPSAEDMKQPFSCETLFSLQYSPWGLGPCYFLIFTILARSI